VIPPPATEELHLFDVDDDRDSGTGRRKASRSKTAPRADLAEAAILLNRAQANLTTAIDAARRMGWSWRRIGAESGLPFQTLHRRFGSRAAEEHRHTPTID
jgi:hypothetical protein